ncbi:hypothetical protein Desdi_1836 [Desulfitobacterium dichloroeliminans LMG P-21439]|uniref:Uncharacterized protein n=1 Tax=Desulfitobacterium dichloroeliminans (strain LMG P-21439 / DCA1) TaxID=871963 RepID=L0F9E3_DESDL|nr:hypothetical protein [Desulfitobacterium dichloroeliminans]AGA69286.1 hypothetical protein Desdi_1836 [Desulfitobacterium dichloroeliminans LMG P-21439]
MVTRFKRIIFKHIEGKCNRSVAKELRNSKDTLIDVLVRPNLINSNLIFSDNIDCFPNYQLIFEILTNDKEAVTLADYFMIKDNILYKNKILNTVKLSPYEDYSSCVYALYRESDNNPLIQTSLELIECCQ